MVVHPTIKVHKPTLNPIAAKLVLAFVFWEGSQKTSLPCHVDPNGISTESQLSHPELCRHGIY